MSHLHTILTLFFYEECKYIFWGQDPIITASLGSPALTGSNPGATPCPQYSQLSTGWNADFTNKENYNLIPPIWLPIVESFGDIYI